MRTNLITASAIIAAGFLAHGCSAPTATDSTPPLVESPLLIMPTDWSPVILPRSEANQAIATLAAGNTAFASDLYVRIIEGEPHANAVFSPFSVSAAMAMVELGARGRTASEIAGTLHFDPLGEDLHPAWAALLGRLAGEELPGVDLRVANRLWGQRGYSILPRFTQQGAAYYNAPMVELDFAAAPEPSRITINEWISDQTADRIQDLIPEGAIDPLTRMVVTNAIYMKADWARPFPKENTHTGEFTTSTGATTTVSYMRQTQSFGYTEWNGWQVVELPYRGDRLAMVILLPREKGSFPELESNLDTGEILGAVRAGLDRHRVEVLMPRFRAEQSITMTDVLQEMGVRAAFGMQADFSGINGRDDLFLSAVVHKAFIEVNEEGTEAAAATAAIIALKSMPIMEPDPISFHATHPFVYFIHDRETGSLLFMGRVASPDLMEDSAETE